VWHAGGKGAIDAVHAPEGQIHFKVLGTTAPGIFGSGLVDAVAVGLDLNLITGRRR